MEVLEVAGLSEEELPPLPPLKSSRLAPPGIITATHELNWPCVGTSESFFDRALTQASGMDANANPIDSLGGGGRGDPLDEWAADDGEGMDAEGDAGEDAEEAWDIAGSEIPGGTLDAEPGESEDLGAEEDSADGEVKEGVEESELWVKNSPLAADHVAAGSFETAMQVSLFSSEFNVLILTTEAKKVTLLSYSTDKSARLSLHR